MKKIILLLIISYYNSLSAQEINATYKFNSPTYNSEETLQFKKGHKIWVKDKVNDHVYFTYLKFGDSSKTSNSLNNTFYFKKLSDSISIAETNEPTSDHESIAIHSLPIKKFNKYTSRYYPRFSGVSASVFTVPYKLRLSDFDFEQNVNLGMNISFPFRIDRNLESKWLVGPTLGIGLATITLNEKNSNISSENNSENGTQTRSAGAFSFSTGLLLQFTENINLGIQYGVDLLGNNDKGIRWKYDKKHWLGIGINIGFNISQSKGSDDKTQ